MTQCFENQFSNNSRAVIEKNKLYFRYFIFQKGKKTSYFILQVLFNKVM